MNTLNGLRLQSKTIKVNSGQHCPIHSCPWLALGPSPCCLTVTVKDTISTLEPWHFQSPWGAPCLLRIVALHVRCVLSGDCPRPPVVACSFLSPTSKGRVPVNGVHTGIALFLAQACPACLTSSCNIPILVQPHSSALPCPFLAHCSGPAVLPFLPHHSHCIQQSLSTHLLSTYYIPDRQQTRQILCPHSQVCVCSWHTPALPSRPELHCGRHLLSVPSFCPVTPRGHVRFYVMDSGHSSHQFCESQRESSAQSPPCGAHGSVSSPPISQPPHLVLTLLDVTESHFPRSPLCRQKVFLPASPSSRSVTLDPSLLLACRVHKAVAFSSKTFSLKKAPKTFSSHQPLEAPLATSSAHTYHFI